MGVHTKLQNQIQNRIQQTKQVIKATVPPKLMERADQVLLGLSYTGQSIPSLLKQTFSKIEGNPNDVIGRLSRTVIEHAASVRATLTKPVADFKSSVTAVETADVTAESSNAPTKSETASKVKAASQASPKSSSKSPAKSSSKVKVTAKKSAKNSAQKLSKKSSKK